MLSKSQFAISALVAVSQASQVLPQSMIAMANGYDMVFSNPLAYLEQNSQESKGQIFYYDVPSYPNEFGIYAPQGWNVYGVSTCSSRSQNIVGQTSYSNEQQKLFTGNMSEFGNYPFSASFTNQAFSDLQVISEVDMMSSQSTWCEYASTQLDIYTPPQFTEGFAQAVMALPMTYDKQTYANFYASWGTHFMDKGTWGTFESTATETYDSVAGAKADLSYSNNGTQASPMPITGNMMPIYMLFAYQDVCNYEFDGISCPTLQQNLMQAAKDYCSVGCQAINQTSHCIEEYACAAKPIPDPVMGAGAITTNNDSGSWGSWTMMTDRAQSSWRIYFDHLWGGIVNMCTFDEAYNGKAIKQTNCVNQEASMSTKNFNTVDIQVPGEMVCVTVEYRQDHAIENVQFGYIDENGQKQTTAWAKEKSRFNFTSESNCITSGGYMMGLRANVSANNDLSLTDIQSYNHCKSTGCTTN